MVPDYEKLYVLDDPFANQPVRLQPYEYEWLERPGAVRLLRGQRFPELPLKLRHYKGGRYIDFLWTTFTPIKVISTRLVELFSEHGFLGWSTYPVEVTDKGGQILPGYFGLSITGKAGDHDLRRVEAVDKPPIVPRGVPYVVLRGLFFEEDEWDGSDFCLMGTTITMIVTERVVKAFRRARIRNVKFTPLPIVETNASVYEVQGLWPVKD